MRQLIFLTISMSLAMQAMAQHKPAYQLFTANGKKTDYAKMLRDAKEKEVILFGELHDNAIAHWLQLELAKDLLQVKGSLVLGAEMMEADNQSAYDGYRKGDLDYKGLDSTARLWNNFKTDYLPLLDFAKVNGLRFIATNVPRRYASQVYKNGLESLDSLSQEETAWMAPLPIRYDPKLPGYQKMMKMAQGHGGENLPKAQAVKDATMAHFILKGQEKGTLILHFNGAYHSDYHDGINWYLLQERPKLKVLTISTVSQADVGNLEVDNLLKADYILVVDEDMTVTY